MLEELRTKSKHSMFVKLIICMVILAVCMVSTKASFITYMKGPLELGTMTEWDVKELEGKYVTFEVDMILGTFVEESSTNAKTNKTTVTGMGYICIYSNQQDQSYQLYAIKANKSNVAEIDTVVYDTLYNDTVTKTYRVTGTFEKMSGEMLQYYDETIEEEIGEEALDYAIPYCIYDETIGGHEYSMAILLNAIAFLSLVVAIIIVVNYTRGHHDRYLKKYLKKNVRETMTGIELDYTSANVLNKNYRIGKKYLFYTKGGTMDIVPLESQIWAYYYRRSGRNSVSQIRFYNVDRKVTYVNIGKELAENILSYLNLSYQHMVIGYDSNLQKMYKNNFNEFLNLKYNEAKVAAATQDAYYAEKDSTME